MVLVVAPDQVDACLTRLAQAGETPRLIGSIRPQPSDAARTVVV